MSGINWTFSRMVRAARGGPPGAPLMRGVVEIEPGHGEIMSAVLHASGLSVFEAQVNGRPVSDEVLAPGWSSYEWRLRYRTYDVTDLVRSGDGTVVVGFTLGNGWACGYLGGQRTRGFWAERPTLIALLEIAYADGHVQLFGTDDRTWQSGPSPVTADDLYGGQSIDARVDVSGWSSDPAPRDGWAAVWCGSSATSWWRSASSTGSRASCRWLDACSPGFWAAGGAIVPTPRGRSPRRSIRASRWCWTPTPFGTCLGRWALRCC